jgi:hypothetical protein
LKLRSTIVGGVDMFIEPEEGIVGKGIEVAKVDVDEVDPDGSTVVPKILDSVDEVVGREVGRLVGRVAELFAGKLVELIVGREVGRLVELIVGGVVGRVAELFAGKLVELVVGREVGKLVELVVGREVGKLVELVVGRVVELVLELVELVVGRLVGRLLELFVGKVVVELDIPFYKRYLLFYDLATILTPFTQFKSLFRSTRLIPFPTRLCAACPRLCRLYRLCNIYSRISARTRFYCRRCRRCNR